MTALPKILTWFVPTAPETLHAHFLEASIVTFRSGDIIQHEDEPYDALYWVESGLVGQAVINHALAKPLAMNLYPTGTMLGFINLFTGLPSPRRLVAQLPGVVLRRISKAKLMAAIEHDAKALKTTACWCEDASKSELIGMEALFTLSADERLALFFTSAAATCGQLTDDGRAYDLPPLVTRAALCDVVYVTAVTLDRLTADWRRQGLLDRAPTGGWRVNANLVHRMVPWLDQH